MGVQLELRDGDGDRISVAPLDEMRIDPPLGSAARKLKFPDGTVFETQDHDAVEVLTGDTKGSILHRYERFSPGLIGVVLGCLAAVWVVYRYGLDILVAAAIAATPAVVIEQIDAGTMQTIDYTMAEPSQLSDADRAKVEKIYQRLVRTLPVQVQEERAFTLLFRDLPGMGPNAFALPGGTMVMTDAFVEDFGSPDIIAGVLGHEIGHVVEDHGLTRLYRSLALFVLITLLAGDVGPVLEDIILEGNVLLSLSFDRDQEREADEFGMTLAHAARYDPRGLKRFFEGLQEEYGAAEPPQWMSTHPSHANRIEAIEKFVEGL
ncbi:MAG: M48 family metallopeptidase [Pseudomonadota bacterium]